MPGSFEKKVQEKMEELKLTPSAPVWDKIEAQIKPERERRRGWFWFPFLVLLLAGGSWWFFAGQESHTSVEIASKPGEDITIQTSETPKKEAATKESTTNVHSTTTTGINKTTNNAEPSAVASARPLQKLTREVKQPPVKEEGDFTGTVARKHERLVPEPSGTAHVETRTINSRSREDNAGTKVNTGISEKASAKKETNSEEAFVVNQAGVIKQTMPADKQTAEKEVTVAKEKSNALTVDSAAQHKAHEKQPLPITTDTAALKRKIAAASKKWKLSVALQAGWQPSASENKSVSADFFSSPVPNNSNNPPVNSGGSFRIDGRPNYIRNGAAFALSTGLTKAVSQRLELTVGLQYTAYRFHTLVGSYKPMDTALSFQSRSVAVGGYYRNGVQEEYTMRYGVLEVPVSLSYKLFSTLPLYLSASASYGRLLKENALSFDRLANVYYKNSDNLNRNFLSLSAAVQYGIVNHPGFNLKAGPMVHYQLTHFHKDQSWTPGRFFAGLKTFIQL